MAQEPTQQEISGSEDENIEFDLYDNVSHISETPPSEPAPPQITVERIIPAYAHQRFLIGEELRGTQLPQLSWSLTLFVLHIPLSQTELQSYQ